MPPTNLSIYRDADSWLESFGFKAYPFDEFVAEREKDLESYFVEFPFFNEIKKPRTTFLFLNRGAGKSANKIILETQCNRSLRKQYSWLAISYTDFYLLTEQKEITLRHHVEAILRQAIPKLYETVTHYSRRLELISKLSEEDREDLIWFLVRYSDSLTPLALKKQLVKFSQEQGWSQEFTSKVIIKITELATKVLERATDVVLPSAGLLVESIAALLEFKNHKEQQNGELFKQPRELSPVDLLKRFGELAKLFEVTEVFILVDRVDEFASTSDFEQATNMLKPLTRVIPLLELFAFKFFLPLEIHSKLAQDGLREDKFPVYSYIWTTQDLKDIFENRLARCCDYQIIQDENERKSFIRLFEPTILPLNNTYVTIVDEMIALANGSPRQLIRLAKAIFDEHTKLPPIQPFISQATYQQALENFK